MPHLHETMYGKNLLEGHIPSMVQSLQKIAKELERANDLKEAELDIKQKELQIKSK